MCSIEEIAKGAIYPLQNPFPGVIKAEQMAYLGDFHTGYCKSVPFLLRMSDSNGLVYFHHASLAVM